MCLEIPVPGQVDERVLVMFLQPALAAFRHCGTEYGDGINIWGQSKNTVTGNGWWLVVEYFCSDPKY